MAHDRPRGANERPDQGHCTTRETTPTVPGVTPTETVDGRTARATRTREAVVTAVLDLVNEGNPKPTAREIADRAGVSLRSVYVHFDDLDDLFGAAATRHVEQIAGLLHPVDAALPLSARITAFCTQRAQLYEVTGPVRRAALVWTPSSETLREVVGRGRLIAWADTKRLFRTEVAEGTEGRAVLEGVNIASSAAAWDVLRDDRGPFE